MLMNGRRVHLKRRVRNVNITKLGALVALTIVTLAHVKKWLKHRRRIEKNGSIRRNVNHRPYPRRS